MAIWHKKKELIDCTAVVPEKHILFHPDTLTGFLVTSRLTYRIAIAHEIFLDECVGLISSIDHRSLDRRTMALRFAAQEGSSLRRPSSSRLGTESQARACGRIDKPVSNVVLRKEILWIRRIIFYLPAQLIHIGPQILPLVPVLGAPYRG